MASVDAKRAVFMPSAKRPIIGSRSTRACQASRAASARWVQRHRPNSRTRTSAFSAPHWRTYSLAASIAWVMKGSSCRACEKALTTCGTT